MVRLLVFLFFVMPPSSVMASEMECVDALGGDTLLFMQGGPSGWRIEVELASVDVPVDPDYARQAEDAARQTCLDRGPLRLEYPFGEPSSGRRTVKAFVFDSFGRMLNRELLREGLGTYRHEPARYQDELEAAERFARGQGVGLWSE